MVDIPNSASLVVSTMALVMSKYLDMLKEEIPNAKFVYDEKLSYPTALTAFRAQNNLSGDYSDFYPLFAFRRSVLRYAENAAGGRRISDRVTRQVTEQLNNVDGKPTTSEIYRPLYAEFDIEFMYITKSMYQLEEFEIAFLSEEGISGIKELKVSPEKALDGPIPAVLQGEFPYYFKYSGLTDKQLETDDVYFKAAAGKILVTGHYLVFRSMAKHILEIDLKLREMNSSILVQQNIT